MMFVVAARFGQSIREIGEWAVDEVIEAHAFVLIEAEEQEKAVNAK